MTLFSLQSAYMLTVKGHKGDNKVVKKARGTVTPRVWFKKNQSDYLYHQSAPFFSESPLLRTPQLSMLAGEQSWDG